MWIPHNSQWDYGIHNCFKIHMFKIYWNVSDRDEGGIPSQFPVQEDTQFCQILRESLDFFGIDEHQQKEFFLIDYKTRKFWICWLDSNQKFHLNIIISVV